MRGVRLAIISDTHMPRGDRALPEECVRRLRAADAILHAGDLVAVEVLELLESLGPPVHAIHGNVDGPDVRRRLPAARVVEAGGARIGMVHDAGPAAGRLRRMRRRFPDADAVVFGHSHLPAPRGGRTASSSSTRARRPSAAARPRTRWARRPWRPTGGCASRC